MMCLCMYLCICVYRESMYAHIWVYVPDLGQIPFCFQILFCALLILPGVIEPATIWQEGGVCTF
uniref:Uncharacterized protein n=1 Tax=Anguilla anguilla TaxID=7936 RepID=A0A0E9XIF1_ANGAN